MLIISPMTRKRIDRLKLRTRTRTAKYYIQKHKKEIEIFQYLYNLQIKDEKKNIITHYDNRIKEKDYEIKRLVDEVKFYKKEWRDYKDMKHELEQIAASIDIEHLRSKFNHFLSVFDYAKDKIEIIGYQHDRKKLIGIKG